MHILETDIANNALPTVVREGRRCFDAGAVSALQVVGSSVSAAVKWHGKYRPVINEKKTGSFDCSCTCGFHMGGACEHAVAVMYAVCAAESVQMGLFGLEALPVDENPPPKPSLSYPPAHFVPSLAFSEEVTDIVEVETIAEIKDIAPKPRCRLYLAECDGMLIAEPRFVYATGLHDPADYEFHLSDPEAAALIPVNSALIVRVLRSKAREQAFLSLLLEHGMRRYQYGSYTPEGDQRVWVEDQLPALTARGMELFGHKDLIHCRVRYSLPKLSLAVKRDGDSFLCRLGLAVDGIPAALAELIRAVQNKEEYILLSDGSSGKLPGSWQKILAEFFTLATPVKGEEGNYRATFAQLPILDMVADLDPDNASEPDPFFEQLRQELRGFSGISQQPVPDTFNGVMRPYQQAGFDWFLFLQSFGFGGCLADDMGLGKTIQAIALLCREQGRGPSIVAAPSAVIYNWESELQKFAPGLSTLLYHGERRHEMSDRIIGTDVIITTYGTLLRDIEFLSGLRLNYVILDEAQVIKNPASRVSRAVCRLQSRCRIAMSGTPIENNLSELWSLFNFLNPGMFGPLASFRRGIVKPIEIEHCPATAAILRRMIFPFVLRRTKKQVATELPPKTEMIIQCEMLPKQRALYDTVREAYLGKILEEIDTVGMARSGIRIIEGMLRLRQICCHPELVERGFAGDSAKIRLFEEYLEEIVSEGHRVLVFSQFASLLDIVRRRLADKGIRYEILTGSTGDRRAPVERFKADPSIPVFLISLKAGGTGLNLTEADYVVHLDPWWNPAAENQASDRAYRIGQTREVMVYKFITRDSIEERVLAFQKEKQFLSDQIISQEDAFFKHLTRSDIVSLFG